MTVRPQEPALRWSQTRALIRSDYDRLTQELGQAGSLAHRVYYFCLPGFQSLLLYRLSRHCYLRRRVGMARIIALAAQYITRTEIPPTTSIGPGALISHPTGVNIMGKIGARLTVRGAGAIGGGFDEHDIGGGPGYPVLGDDVVLAYGAHVLGAVRIGNGVRIGPGALVTFDLPDHALVPWARPRVIQGGAAPREVAP